MTIPAATTKRRRRTAIILLSVAILVALEWLASQPIYCKLLFGMARILSQQVDVVLEIDGRLVPGVRCFKESTLYDGRPSDRLVLYIDDPNTLLKRHIILVAPAHGMVLLPKPSTRDYRLIRDRWLIQSDSGAEGVAFGDTKLDDRDPDFRRSKDTCSFTIPPVLDLPAGRWNLRISAGI